MGAGQGDFEFMFISIHMMDGLVPSLLMEVLLVGSRVHAIIETYI